MAISADLRRRAVEAYERGEGHQTDIAERFAVGVASLGRWLKIKRDTGSVERAPRAGGNPRRVTPAGEAMLRAWLEENVSTPQHELAARLGDAGEPAVCQQTVGRTLERMALTLKKSRSAPSSDSGLTS
jgi:transposase